jgi:hypothetical protein
MKNFCSKVQIFNKAIFSKKTVKKEETSDYTDCADFFMVNY